MTAFWDYLWPVLFAGFVFGIVAGVVGFRWPRAVLNKKAEPAPPEERRRKCRRALGAGVIACGVAVALWHGPMGGADRFSTRVEHNVRSALDYLEMKQVSGRLHRSPLSRQLFLSGPADDFQRSELVRYMDQVPGVRATSWESTGGGLPLIAEGFAASLLGYLLGLLLAYLLELRRRYNSQWNW
jgi:hypothetical protein